MNQQIINLFDEYTHKPLSRNEFLKRLARITGSTAAALTILPLLEVNHAKASEVPEDDDSIVKEDITFEGDGAVIKAYLAKPKGKGKFGSAVVIHENRGLNGYTKDVARRIAKGGFIGLAIDALSPAGGTPLNEDDARKMIGELDPQKNLNNYLRGLEYLRNRKDSNKKTATIGFCWGGALANQLAVNEPLLNAAIAFYGRQPETTLVNKIKARVQLHYGALDERINAGIPAYEEALKAAGTDYELFVYEGAQHAFHNDTAPTRYNAEAARLAWERVLKLLKETIA